MDENTKLAIERTTLAYERTFLAWVRTGLASVGGGVAILKLLSFQTEKHQIIANLTGSALIGIGISIFILTFMDYRKQQPQKHFWFISSILLILGIVSLLLLIISIK